MEQSKNNFFFDASVGGYLMIGTGTGFITGVSFQEILVGTENFIAQSRWRQILLKEGGSAQIYIETATLCQQII
jgi:hypothetical protein